MGCEPLYMGMMRYVIDEICFSLGREVCVNVVIFVDRYGNGCFSFVIARS